jgi:hypothetical protein
MPVVLRQLLTVLAIGLAGPTLAGQTLVMVERDGCVYCAAWDAAIAPIYAKTPEGQAAPLERVNIRDMQTSGLTFAAPVVFTPTFALMEDGREIDRIEGYPGEDFFWGLLGQMLAKTEK